MKNLQNKLSKSLKKTAHIVYPFDLNKKINPWSIGNNLYLALKENIISKFIIGHLYKK